MNKEMRTSMLLGQSLLIVLVWLGWVLLMRWFPEPFANVYLRGLVRIGILLVPAYLFLRKSGTPWLEGWYLRVNWQRGVIVGLVVSALFLSFTYFAQSREAELVWQLPVKADTWFNWIIGSPFAEEAWFRAVLFGELDRKYGLTYALLGSSLMFGLLHLPTWIFFRWHVCQLNCPIIWQHCFVWFGFCPFIQGDGFVVGLAGSPLVKQSIYSRVPALIQGNGVIEGFL